MKYAPYLTVVLLLVLNSTAFSQKNINSEGGEFKLNSGNHHCLTHAQREIIIDSLKKSQSLLRSQNKLAIGNTKAPSPLFTWPVQKASHINYNEVWAISNYVDHNLAYPDLITDYNGGTKSYDTQSGYNHQGIDIFTWPYYWKLQDDDGAEVIAASDGQILYKSDGQFDRSCTFNSNSWNAVYVQHDDGSVAWYGHLKNGSLTTKNIGDLVTQGEYLGVIGSSGNSTGPHLHFEVYEDDTYTFDKLIDPYAGPSNSWNLTSWWAVQKPYRNPTINALTTNSTYPDFGTCPNAEITNEKNTFQLNETAYFLVFLKDQLGLNLNLKVYKPDSSIAYEWDRSLVDDYTVSWWSYSGIVDVVGEWRAEALLDNGQTVSHVFDVVFCDTENAAFSYDAFSYCVGGADPSPIVAGEAGGTFSSSPAGLSIDTSGVIDVSASTPNSYTVTYTISGICSNSSNVALTIRSVDTGISTIGNSITSNENNATYQWLDCVDSWSVIANENNQSFTSFSDGSFAVEVTRNGCIDTSECATIAATGILESTGIEPFIVLPNPTKGHFDVKFDNMQLSLSIKLLSITGQLIQSKHITNSREIGLTINQPSGIYFAEITDQNNLKEVLKILKE